MYHTSRSALCAMALTCMRNSQILPPACEQRQIQAVAGFVALRDAHKGADAFEDDITSLGLRRCRYARKPLRYWSTARIMDQLALSTTDCNTSHLGHH